MTVSRLALVACSLTYFVPQAAFAQDGAAAAQLAETEVGAADIIVTARRTAERLQDVPVAVTALTGEAIEERNMRTVADIQAVAPSLNFTTTNAQGSKAAVALRGQRQSGSGIGVDPSVGVYINEMYMARASIDTSLYDLESVQVLKGPQGTLFGRNTTGGAVLVSSKRPGDYLGGYVRAQFEDPWAYTLEGAVNVSLGDGNGLRVAGTRQYRRGYTEVVNLNARTDGRNRYGARASLNISSGDLATLFVGEYYRWNDSGVGNFPLSRVPTASNAFYNAFDQALAAQRAGNYLENRQTESTVPLFSRGRNYSALNVTTYELSDTITFKNIVGYAATNDQNAIDYDSTAVPILATRVDSSQDQFSEEAQIQGKSFGGSLDWILGAYYFREKGWDLGGASVFSNPTGGFTGTRNFFEATNSARSVFAHASYLLPIGMPAHIFGGMRVGSDTRKMDFMTYRQNLDGSRTCLVSGSPAANGVTGGECLVTDQKTFKSTTWNVGVDVKPMDDLLLFGSVAKGYRTGGFNGRATTLVARTPFDPETVLNYEVGFKFAGELGGMRTVLNVSAYHSKYEDIQQNVIFNVPPPIGGISSSVINAAQGRVNGLEVEFSVRPVRQLTLSGFYSLTDAEYTEFTQATSGGGTQDLSNNSFAGIPRNTGGASIAWTAFENTEVGNLQFRVDYRYLDGYELDPINQFANSRIDSYSLWNASVRLEEAFGSRFSIEIYAKNIFDKTYANGGFSSYGLGFVSQTLGDPRVIGIGIRLPFGDE